MGNVCKKGRNTISSSCYSRLGLDNEIDQAMFFVEDIDKHSQNSELWFQLEKAKTFSADAVFIKNTLDGHLTAQLYVYDLTGANTVENDITEIHKKVWTAGDVPLVCVFTTTRIEILNTSVPIDNKKYLPNYLAQIEIIGKAHNLYNEHFASKLKSGAFWDDENIELSFERSSYNLLISHLKKIISSFVDKSNIDRKLTQRLVIQSILVKYLEERVNEEDPERTKVFPPDFFSQFGGADSFCDTLRKNTVIDLFNNLNNNHFNGGIFVLAEEEKMQLANCDLNPLATALEGYCDVTGQGSFWRQYAFNYIPVELISRLYEEFIEDRSKRQNGIIYTPSHLAKFIVDELMPINSPKQTTDFKVIDPACGSGIFLVIAYKRLIQWWRILNKYKRPSLDTLKSLLCQSIYGIDIKEESAKLTAFSLCIALCDELTPKQIWNDLKFDDLTQKNIIYSDFFAWFANNKHERFDIIVGNPPFVRGGVKKELAKGVIGNTPVKIPREQIALKFLCDAISLLRPNANLGMILKSASILYNSTSQEYRHTLFSNIHVDQILDFTPLARNKTLWDSKEPDACALFLTNHAPNSNRNILHAIFRRTKVTKSRIAFEIDDYDLHFVRRQEACENPHIFKINLLGGGRIRNIYNRYKLEPTLGDWLKENKSKYKLICGEGDGKQKAPHYSFFDSSAIFNNYQLVANFKHKDVYNVPNFLIRENIGVENKTIEHKVNEVYTPFYNEIWSIHSRDKKILSRLDAFFKNNMDFIRFWIYITSGKLLVYKNTSFLTADILNIPFNEADNFRFDLSESEKEIINYVTTDSEEFARHGESARCLLPINNKELKHYCEILTKTLNLAFSTKDALFQQAQTIRFKDGKFLGVLLVHDDQKVNLIEKTVDYSDYIEQLTNTRISDWLYSKRIIIHYSLKSILLIKPNQTRYWSSLTAYRDADKIYVDYSNR